MTEKTTDQVRFADLGLSDAVLAALKDVGYETPSAIQAETIPYLLDGRDVLGQAQTGTGKTAAFALPLISNMKLGKPGKPQLLILAPTRELAIQVAEALQRYASHIPGFQVAPIYGGADFSAQNRQLKRGVHAVVGTPGRVMDHMRRNTLDLSGLSALVLDEADEMLRMGFIDDVEWVLTQTPQDRQIALFSATMPRQIHKIATTYLNNPAEVKIKTNTTTASTIRQRYWLIKGVSKLEALTRVLETEDFDGMIIFVRTKNATVELAEKCQARGYAAAAINGDMAQNLRERTIAQLKNGKLDILIATDVAARGLDVDRISHVINYDMPHDAEIYVHRIGRTGRAGRKGDAILFASPREQRMLKSIERVSGKPIEPMEPPSWQDVNESRVRRFQASITNELENGKLDAYVEMLGRYQHENEVDPLQLAAALASLAQGDQPLFLEKPTKQQRDNDRADRNARFEKNDSRGDRGDRKERPRREKSRSDSRPERSPADMGALETGKERFRIAVGNNDGVKPGNIVGAIANECGMDSEHIGRIVINSDHSFIDLPDGMPTELFDHLKNVYVCKKKLEIARIGGGGDSGSSEAPNRRPSRDTGKKAARDSNREARRDSGSSEPATLKRSTDKSAAGRKPKTKPSDKPGRKAAPKSGGKPFAGGKPKDKGAHRKGKPAGKKSAD